jgi:outer membrane protein OmpA-like peptidoglycan-associated protein
MIRRSVPSAPALLAALFALAACGDRGGEGAANVDPTTVDVDATSTPGVVAPYHQTSAPPPKGDAPPGATTQIVLPSGAPVYGGPAHVQVQQALAGGGQVAVPLGFLRFDQGSAQPKQDPDTSLTTLAAVLNAYPRSRVVVEASGPDRALTERRAAETARALINAGVAAERVSSRVGGGASDGVNLVVNAAAAGR